MMLHIIGKDIPDLGGSIYIRRFYCDHDLIEAFVLSRTAAVRITGRINFGRLSDFTIVEIANMFLDTTRAFKAFIHAVTCKRS
jgi:hypothetical protein